MLLLLVLVLLLMLRPEQIRPSISIRRTVAKARTTPGITLAVTSSDHPRGNAGGVGQRRSSRGEKITMNKTTTRTASMSITKVAAAMGQLVKASVKPPK